MEKLAVIAIALATLLWIAWPLMKVTGSETRRCPSCGAPYKPGDKYCSRCGRKLPKGEQR
jgi:predicted amidophosphoribosyltransferase